MNISQIVVGLGNPGKEYELTRHNVGFMLVDLLAAEYGAQWHSKPNWSLEIAEVPISSGSSRGKLLLLKPQTYMNDSGRAVRQVFDFYRFSDLNRLWVAHDDLDIEVGKTKVQLGTGPKVHNGLSSIYQHLGSEDFWHVRVGVDGRGGDRALSGREYVLQPFTPDERAVLQPSLSSLLADLKLRLEA
jgi:peptidyl-tRNA hydrolase, PTH1 family